MMICPDIVSGICADETCVHSKHHFESNLCKVDIVDPEIGKNGFFCPDCTVVRITPFIEEEEMEL